ncbi:sensor histidine kinase, partial [Streptomyces sp. NPDC002537]
MKRLGLPGGERARLTLLYGGLLVLAGGMLISLVNFLVRQGLYASITTAVATKRGEVTAAPAPSLVASLASTSPVSPDETKRFQTIKTFSEAAEQAAQNRLLFISLIALAVFAVISAALAWWMAGRVLRPVGVITR